MEPISITGGAACEVQKPAGAESLIHRIMQRGMPFGISNAPEDFHKRSLDMMKGEWVSDIQV